MYTLYYVYTVFYMYKYAGIQVYMHVCTCMYVASVTTNHNILLKMHSILFNYERLGCVPFFFGRELGQFVTSYHDLEFVIQKASEVVTTPSHQLTDGLPAEILQNQGVRVIQNIEVKSSSN